MAGRGTKPRADKSAITYDEHLARNTGFQSPTQSWQAGHRRSAELKAQSEAIARKLESQGIPAYRAERNAVMISEVTGIIEPVKEFRATRILPIVAQRDRAPMLNALRYFQQTQPLGPYLRLAVITTGHRLASGTDLRGIMRKLHRTISKWASEVGALYGVRIIYRGTEFTIDNAKTFHPHANVIYAPSRTLSKDRWQAFLDLSRCRLGAWWKDCGRLANPDEAIKYPFKPLDLDSLTDSEFAWLYGELERLKLAQPMGAFADFCRELENQREKIGFIAGPRGGGLARIQKLRRSPGNAGTNSAQRVPQPENQIISRTAPMPRHTPWWEPHTIVQNYTDTPQTQGGALRLDQLRDRSRRSRAAWEKNGAPSPEEALSKAKGD
jgi:hypothetical protein